MKGKLASRLGLAASGFVLWFAIWEWATVAGPLRDVYGIPTARETIGEVVTLASDGTFWEAVAQTLGTTVVALGIATVLGVALGVAMGMSPWVSAALGPLTQFLRPVPAVVVLPLVLLIVGPTTELAIVLAVMGAIWPILIQSQVGVRDVDPVALDTARAMALSKGLTQTSVVLPSALPYVATGVRIATGVALMMCIGAGILGGSPGLGRSIAVAQQSGDPARVFGMLLWAGVIGLLLNAVLASGEHRLSRGRREEVVT
ncbi:ABC-type nitrate/sulfonate/bicarbonate transport system permease component [Nocardioides aromaticivorans]|uniref:ABC-type nitrate/sulfonate/bicarbonate transport system permease component n=1 Tax=Nocardioides aromaticivorans TaxID=200618 RepID=A0A7Z0CNC4_9ACTN|nr:ABC transporter permease subunit [Nocardioides aromaticivorans]NYI45028.1 ABC-type nitrate/sulfonate/bicarbonate transport system permease component [Nocardioides aromaticivorans]